MTSSRKPGRPPRAAEKDRRSAPKPRREPTGVELSKGLQQELTSSARPGKGDVLIGVFERAVAAYAADDIDEAIRLGEQAKHIALRSTSVREFLGLAFYAAGRWKDAARELAAFRRISGSTSQNHVLADCYRAEGRPDKALEYCNEVERDSVPEDVYYEAQIVASGALADGGDLEGAIARLLRLDIEPELVKEHHLRVWYVLGDLLERKGRFTQARQWFEAVASADPDLTDADERVKKLGSGN